MIRRLPVNALSKAIYDILSTKQTTLVFDGEPGYKKDDAGNYLRDSDGNRIPVDFPYILISDYEYEFGGAKDIDITDVMFELEIWTSYAGKKEVNTIAEEVVNVLTAWPMDLSADGFIVSDKDAKGGKGTRSEENFYGIVNFSVKVQNVGG